jgi:hypothetical protein
VDHITDVTVVGLQQVDDDADGLAMGGHQHHDRPAQPDRVLGRTRDALQFLPLGQGQVPHEHFRMTRHQHLLPRSNGQQPALVTRQKG